MSLHGSPTALAELLDVLDVRRTGSTSFRGGHPTHTLPRLFGGQTMAQALVAAGRTVPEGRLPHSLHAYFLRGGHPRRPVDLAVTVTRDGGSFSTRHVTAAQGGEPILEMLCSFHAPEQGLSHQSTAPVGAPAPDDVPPLRNWLRSHSDHLPDWWTAPQSFDLRFLAEPTGLTHGRTRLPEQRFWMRAADRLPPDPVLHAAVVTYASDLTLLDATLFPHGLSWYRDDVFGASLDHSLWFHHEPRADEWLLCTQRSPVGHGGRAWADVRMTDRQGRLLVTGAQEGLIRSRARSAAVDR